MAINAPSLDDLYDRVGEKYDIDPLRIKAHAIQETGERANLASSDGKSWGFGQFRPETWQRVMPGVPLSARGDPATAIEAMGKYLAELDAAHTDANGNVDVRASTAAYNGSGPAADAYAESVRGIHARLARGGGLKVSDAQKPGAKAAPAEEDSPFRQTLKGGPAKEGAAPTDTPTDTPDNPEDSPFRQTLKGGPATPAQEATAQPDAFGLDVGKMAGQPDYAGAVKMGRDLSTTAGVRNALQPPEGYTTSGILPMAVKNDPSGQADPSLGVRWDLGPLRPLATGVLDLAEGLWKTDPAHPQLSPEAQSVLFGAMTGGQLAPSIARGTGEAVARNMLAAADRKAAPLSPEFTAQPLAPDYAGPRLSAAPGQTAAGPSPGMGGPQPQGATAPPQFLDSTWIRGQGSDAAGQYDMSAGGKAMASAVDDALKRGDSVVLMTDGGRKAVPITAVKNGMMVDAQGAPQGAAMIAADTTGTEGVRITPKAGTQPQAAGAAATPSGQAEMSMADYKANRKQGELNAIMEPASSGADDGIYVQTKSGAQSNPTLAERSGDPSVSQQERLLRERDPNKFEPALRANNAARVEQFEEDMGSAPAREAINQDIQDLAKAEQPLVLRNAAPLDLAHTEGVLNGILKDPRQSEIDAVRKVIAPLRDALYDADGKLKVDASSGWGMIDNIRNKIENAGLETSMERHVVGQLLDVKKALTQDMDASTGGRFSEYLGKQAALLQQRNAMDVLQNFRSQLTNAKGEIQFAAYHRWLLGLAKKRGAPGADPAMAISDTTMRKLIGIDKDLKRAQNIDLGSSRGSHTNLMFALSKSMGLGLVHAAVHGGLAAMGGGGFGNLVAQHALTSGAAKVNVLTLGRKVRKHLAPGPQGENWLNGP